MKFYKVIWYMKFYEVIKNLPLQLYAYLECGYSLQSLKFSVCNQKLSLLSKHNNPHVFNLWVLSAEDGVKRQTPTCPSEQILPKRTFLSLPALSPTRGSPEPAHGQDAELSPCVSICSVIRIKRLLPGITWERKKINQSRWNAEAWR